MIALGDFKGGGLWIEDAGDQGPVVRVLPTGETRAGFVQDIHDRPYKFDGLRWHSAEPWCGKGSLGHCGLCSERSSNLY